MWKLHKLYEKCFSLSSCLRVHLIIYLYLSIEIDKNFKWLKVSFIWKKYIFMYKKALREFFTNDFQRKVILELKYSLQNR